MFPMYRDLSKFLLKEPIRKRYINNFGDGVISHHIVYLSVCRAVYCRIFNRNVRHYNNYEIVRCWPLWTNSWTHCFAVLSKFIITKSLLILPQILEIFRKSRVAGISHSLIFLNLVGDIIKIFYFFLKVTN